MLDEIGSVFVSRKSTENKLISWIISVHYLGQAKYNVIGF